jgi:hypothetical protein
MIIVIIFHLLLCKFCPFKIKSKEYIMKSITLHSQPQTFFSVFKNSPAETILTFGVDWKSFKLPFTSSEMGFSSAMAIEDHP